MAFLKKVIHSAKKAYRATVHIGSPALSIIAKKKHEHHIKTAREVRPEMLSASAKYGVLKMRAMKRG